MQYHGACLAGRGAAWLRALSLRQVTFKNFLLISFAFLPRAAGRVPRRRAYVTRWMPCIVGLALGARGKNSRRRAVAAAPPACSINMSGFCPSRRLIPGFTSRIGSARPSPLLSIELVHQRASTHTRADNTAGIDIAPRAATSAGIARSTRSPSSSAWASAQLRPRPAALGFLLDNHAAKGAGRPARAFEAAAAPMRASGERNFAGLTSASAHRTEW